MERNPRRVKVREFILIETMTMRNDKPTKVDKYFIVYLDYCIFANCEIFLPIYINV